MAGALAFHKLKLNQTLDEDEYNALDSFIKEIDWLTAYDTSVINNIANLDYFSQKYRYYDLKKVKVREFYEDLIRYGIKASEFEVSLLNDRALLLIHRARIGFGSDTESVDSILFEFGVFDIDGNGNLKLLSDCEEKTLERLDNFIFQMNTLLPDDLILINALTESQYFKEKYDLEKIKSYFSANVSETVGRLYDEIACKRNISEEAMNEMSLFSCAYFYQKFELDFLNIATEEPDFRDVQEFDWHKIACIYFEIGNIKILDNSDNILIDNYFRSVKKFDYTDIEVYNRLAMYGYFREKYNYIYDTDLIALTAEGMYKKILKTAKLKGVVVPEINRFSKYGITLFIKMYDLENKIDIVLNQDEEIRHASWVLDGIESNNKIDFNIISFRAIINKGKEYKFVATFAKKKIHPEKYLINNFRSFESIEYVNGNSIRKLEISEFNEKNVISLIEKSKCCYALLREIQSRYQIYSMHTTDSYFSALFFSKKNTWHKEESKCIGVNKDNNRTLIYEPLKNKLELIFRTDIKYTFFDLNMILSDPTLAKSNEEKIQLNNSGASKILNENNKNKIVVYDEFSKAADYCLKNKHSIIINKIQCKRKTEYSSVSLNTYYCQQCNTHYIHDSKFAPYRSYSFNQMVLDLSTNKSKSKITNTKTETLKKLSGNNEINNSIRNICIEDFLVRSTLIRCVNKNHSLARIKASVSILTNNRGMIEETFDAYYCKDCNKSYILESTYNRLKSLGHICCKVVEYDDLAQNYSTFSSWQKKSLLAMYGYNVNKVQALSAAKRHKILDILIQNEVMRPYEIISHLEMLIRTRKNLKSMSDAREKWEEDIDYVQHYNKVDNTVKVKSIYAHVNNKK